MRTEIFFLSVVELQSGNSGLISIGSSDAEHPAKHPYGLNRAGQSSTPQLLNLTRLSSSMIQRQRTVQKLFSVNPRAIHSNERRLSRSSRDSSFLWTCRWGGCSKFFLRSEVMSSPAGKTSRGRLRARKLAAPAVGPCGRPIADSGRSHSSAPGVLACPTQTGGVEHHCVWSVTRAGIAF